LPDKPFPRFFVVGPQKCGTTTIYGLLRQHPDIFLPQQKETHFFFWNGREPNFVDYGAREINQNSVTELDAYQRLFASAGKRVCGEVCPTYLYAPAGAGEIHRAAPNAKIVTILRNPIARSFSAYRFMQMIGSEKARSFEEALALEDDHRRDNWQTMSHYVSGSLYAPQLARYYDTFDPANILAIDFEDLKRDPIEVTDRILAFIGLPPLPATATVTQTNKTVPVKSGLVRELLVHHRGGISVLGKMLPKHYRSRMRDKILSLFAAPDETLKPDTVAQLAGIFRADVSRVERLTGLDLAHWKI
jgi:hypothetical protein